MEIAFAGVFSGGFNPMQVVVGAFAALGGILILVAFIRTIMLICPPNEALVISGFGKRRGSSSVVGGRAWRIPFLQRVDRMSLSLMEVPIQVRNAYSKGGIAMNLEAIANVKISSNDQIIGNAIERFLNRDMGEVRRVAKETLEGHLRGVVATLTPEQVNEDRLAFADALTSETETDLNKLGLHLDTFKILHVSDEVGYLDATGRKAIANIVRAAEIAESDSRRAAEQIEAEYTGRATVTRAEVEGRVIQKRNDLRRIQAEISSKVKSEEERTSAAAREARATAEQRLQAVRAELEAIRQQVETVLPAAARREAEEFRARGEAAIIRERGRAVAEALELLYASWQKAGPNAKQISLIEELEKIIAAAAKGVKKVTVDQISIIDSGDGKGMTSYLSSYPAMLDAVFAAVDKTVGINVTDIISGREDQKK